MIFIGVGLGFSTNNTTSNILISSDGHILYSSDSQLLLGA